jgi:hypothetical protein
MHSMTAMNFVTSGQQNRQMGSAKNERQQFTDERRTASNGDATEV